MWKSVATRPGAGEIEIARAERDLGVRFPDHYRRLLFRSDGLEGFATPDVYVALWSCSELVPSNLGYEVAEFLPGFTLIGTDGGGNGYGFTWEHGQAVRPLGEATRASGVGALSSRALPRIGTRQALRRRVRVA